MDDETYRILRKYSQPKIPHHKDGGIIRKLVNEGLMITGTKKEAVPQDGAREAPIAWLTEEGFIACRVERFRRSPILGPLYDKLYDFFYS